MKSLYATALISEDETNCAIKQENVILQCYPLLKLGD